MNGYVKQLMNTDIVAFKNRTESKISKYQRACCFEQWMSLHRGDNNMYCQRDYSEVQLYNHRFCPQSYPACVTDANSK